MFIILFLLSLFFITLIFCTKSYYTYCVTDKKIGLIISKILLLILLFIYAIELTAVSNNGFVYTNKINLEQYTIAEKVNIYNIDNRFWTTGKKIEETILTEGRTPEYIEYRSEPVENILESKVTVYYLPISRYIIKMEYLSKEDNVTFKFFQDNVIYLEHMIMMLITLISFIAFIIVFIKYYRKLD